MTYEKKLSDYIKYTDDAVLKILALKNGNNLRDDLLSKSKFNKIFTSDLVHNEEDILFILKLMQKSSDSLYLTEELSENFLCALEDIEFFSMKDRIVVNKNKYLNCINSDLNLIFYDMPMHVFCVKKNILSYLLFPPETDVPLIEIAEFRKKKYGAPEDMDPIDFYADQMRFTMSEREVLKNNREFKGKEKILFYLAAFLNNPEYYETMKPIILQPWIDQLRVMDEESRQKSDAGDILDILTG